MISSVLFLTNLWLDYKFHFSHSLELTFGVCPDQHPEFTKKLNNNNKILLQVVSNITDH